MNIALVFVTYCETKMKIIEVQHQNIFLSETSRYVSR